MYYETPIHTHIGQFEFCPRIIHLKKKKKLNLIFFFKIMLKLVLKTIIGDYGFNFKLKTIVNNYGFNLKKFKTIVTMVLIRTH